MIPQQPLMLRAYLRDIGKLELPPHETSEEFMERMKHARRDKLKALKTARELKEINDELQK